MLELTRKIFYLTLSHSEIKSLMRINNKTLFSFGIVASFFLSACGGSNSNIAVAPTYTMSANVTGLAATESVVLLNNGLDPLTITSNAVLTPFATKAVAYAVTVGTQPAGQRCVVTNGTGTATAAVLNITVTCNSIVSGAVTGLPNAQQLTLLNNVGDTVTVTGGGSGTDLFAFPVAIADGGAYAVTVGDTVPAGYVCSVSNGSGTVSGVVTGIAVSCALTPYTITASISANNFNSNIDSYYLKIGDSVRVPEISPVIFSRTVGTATFSFQVPRGSTFTLAVNRPGCSISGSLPAGVSADLINSNSSFPAATATPTANISGIAFSCP